MSYLVSCTSYRGAFAPKNDQPKQTSLFNETPTRADSLQQSVVCHASPRCTIPRGRISAPPTPSSLAQHTDGNQGTDGVPDTEACFGPPGTMHGTEEPIMHDIEHTTPDTAAREDMFTLCDPLIPLNTVHDRTEVPCGNTADNPEIQSNTELAEDQQEKGLEMDAPEIKESFIREHTYNLSHLFNEEELTHKHRFYTPQEGPDIHQEMGAGRKGLADEGVVDAPQINEVHEGPGNFQCRKTLPPDPEAQKMEAPVKESFSGEDIDNPSHFFTQPFPAQDPPCPKLGVEEAAVEEAAAETVNEHPKLHSEKIPLSPIILLILTLSSIGLVGHKYNPAPLDGPVEHCSSS